MKEDNRLNLDMHARIGYLDAAKGIAIICIVIGHSYSYHTGNGITLIPYLYSFHVPVFFVITGILYARRTQMSFSILKKAKELMLPYFIWGAAYQICLGCLSIIGGETIRQQFSTRIPTWLQLTSGAMWFLPTMFVATILFQASCKCNNKLFRLCFCVIAFLIGALAPHNSAIAESLWRGLIGFSFITIAYYTSALFTKRVKWYGWIMLLVLDIMIVHYYGTANLSTRSLGIIPLYVLVSLLGSWLCITGCNNIESKRFNHIQPILERLGRYSIIVLCTHQIILLLLQLADYKVLNNKIQETGEFEGVIMATCVITITYMIIPTLIRYLGWTFGLSKSIN